MNLRFQPDYESRLGDILLGNIWLMRVLEAARDLDLADWAVGAGTIRNAVWDRLHGYSEPTRANDVDVVYYDPADLSPGRDAGIEAALKERLPDVPWEVTNQAGVHLWYSQYFGGEPVPPLTSVSDAIGTWPETATCVGVRLERDGCLSILAPYGLDDLFSMILRRNPRRVTLAEYRKRLAEKRIQDKWPLVTIIDG